LPALFLRDRGYVLMLGHSEASKWYKNVSFCRNDYVSMPLYSSRLMDFTMHGEKQNHKAWHLFNM